MALLEVRDLHTCFQTRKGLVRAVNGATFSLNEGETLAIVGESGSGKSVTAMSILRLLDKNGFIESGQILFQTDAGAMDLAKLPLEDMYAIRGDRISMIFQEPMTALNPVFTIGRQLCEPFLIHRKMSKKEAWAEAKRLSENRQESAKALAEHFQTMERLSQASTEELCAIDDVGGICAESIVDFFSREETKLLLERLRESGVNMTDSGEKRTGSGTAAELRRGKR